MLLSNDQLPAVFEKITNIILGKYDAYKIYVYGSYARGLQHEGSDIDIQIIMKLEDPKERVYRYDLSLNEKLTELIGIDVHCVFSTSKFDGNQWCEKLIYHKTTTENG